MGGLNHNYYYMVILLSGLVVITTAHSAGQVSLAARLKVDAESPKCWESLIELQACTGEVIMFFLDGETHLDAGCCHAIRVIGEQCWPAMFGSIGFTPQEADVLQGFCEALVASSPPPPPASYSPAHQPASASASARLVFT